MLDMASAFACVVQGCAVILPRIADILEDQRRAPLELKGLVDWIRLGKKVMEGCVNVLPTEYTRPLLRALEEAADIYDETMLGKSHWENGEFLSLPAWQWKSGSFIDRMERVRKEIDSAIQIVAAYKRIEKVSKNHILVVQAEADMLEQKPIQGGSSWPLSKCGCSGLEIPRITQDLRHYESPPSSF